MKKLTLVAVLVAAPAFADDARHAIFSDSAAVATLRPIALMGALRRLGTGWERFARNAMPPLPGAVSPLDPAVLALTGIDPAGVAWLGVRPLRGGLHVRVALPLVEARIADALLHTLGTALHVSIERGASSWTTRMNDGTPIVARLDGTLLVIDSVLPNATMMPTPADVARVVPLRPPRAFAGTRGAQKRMAANDAFALWADLDAVAKLGQQRGEAQMSQALKGLAPAQRAAIATEGRAELARCKASMNALPRSFDDVLFAVSVTSPDRLRVELAESGRKSALDGLRAARTAPTHTLPDCTDADVCLTAIAPPIPKLGAHHELQRGCEGPTVAAEIAWSWPALLGTDDRAPWLMVLRGLHALSLAIPSGTDVITQLRFIATAELDASTRADVDRLLASLHFDATSPVQVGGRSLTTWTPPAFGGEMPVVVLDPGTGTSTVGAFGARALVRAALDKIQGNAAPPTSTVATMTLTSHALRVIGKQAGAELSFVDGVTQLDGALSLDDDVIRLDTDLSLKP